jgi:putative ABC transport system substrate-binding protein
MRRREFITLLGGVTVWPLAAHAQSGLPIIGFLGPSAPEKSASRVAGFRQGLGETGFVEGRNVVVEYRWARNNLDLLPALAADLARLPVVLIATETTVAALAAKQTTRTIPIVFRVAGDPVRLGLVSSLNRPGGNITGVSNISAELVLKRFGLLRELQPHAARFAVLIDPRTPIAESISTELRTAASRLGLQIEVLFASSDREIDQAFESVTQKQVAALLVSPNPLFGDRRAQLINLAARHAVPVIYNDRDSVEAGGLMSYGANFTDQLRQAGVYVGRILKGEKPADLPVAQPTKFEFVINLKTAKALGITLPPTLLATADEVIE